VIPVAGADRGLERLGVGHVDLCLMYLPQRRATLAWPGMEHASGQEG
jgi:hypothetical protein